MTPLGRPVQLRDTDDVVAMIRTGRALDDALDAIIEAANERKQKKHDDLLAAVRAEFGPNAYVAFADSPTPKDGP